MAERALRNPLALPDFAEALAAELDRAESPSDVLSGLAAHLPSPPPEVEAAAGEDLGSILPSPTALLDSPRGKLQTAHLPPAMVAALRSVLVLLEDADRAARRWDRRGGPPRLPNRAAEAFFIEPDTTLLRARSHPAGPDLAFVEAARGLDTLAMVADSAAFLAGVEALLPALREAAEELDPASTTLLRLETSLGPVVLGGRAGETHRGDAALLIDPGGDDTWLNNAGGNLGVRSRVALAIDLAGQDRYQAGRAHTQGAGIGGLGVLIDAGSTPDVYLGSQHCQGAGFLGVGVLWDQGGDDMLEADQFAQGAGAFGVGLYLDSGGSERMSVRGRGQGFSSTGGIGALVDLAGNDQRRLGLGGADVEDAYAGGGQGASWGVRPFPWSGRPALPGGLGLLYDRAGSDRLYARAFAQGHGWFGGVGVLVDRAGDDGYAVEIEGMGAASHHAAGVLIDGGGNDRYEGTARAIGAADDASAGLVFDRGGDDQYLVHLVASAAPRELGPGLGWARRDRALGLVVDADGDDTYVGADRTLGWALPASRPDREPRAALLDLGGDDRYQLAADRTGAAPADGAVWLQGSGGLGIDQPSSRVGWEDLSWEGAPPAPTEPATPDLAGSPAARWAALRALYDAAVEGRAEPLPPAVKELALGDVEPAVRREAARVLAASGDLDGVDILVDSLVHTSEDNDPDSPAASLVLWLGLLTGEQQGFDPARWRTAWGGMRDGFDLPGRWEALAGLIRARRASNLGDVDAMLGHCSDALALLPHEAPPRRLCGGLASQWALALAHPESGGARDPDRALTLAREATRWVPERAEPFISLAYAFAAAGDEALARKALDRAEVFDPDHRRAAALRRRIDPARSN